HQRMENEALYPRLMEHPDARISGPARELFRDLGGIYDLFVDLDKRFATSEMIRDARAEYCSAVRRVLERLFLRMQREDTELYALAERANVTLHSTAPPPLETDEEVDAQRARALWHSMLPPEN